MTVVSFADIVHQYASFSREKPSEAIILDLIDTRWFQRLRDISQTANTRLVYMFSEHSRFGHSVGVAYLATLLLEKLSEKWSVQIEPYRTAVCAAALLHDIAHIAPGSHIAYKTWFPESRDMHEELAARVVHEDQEIHATLQQQHETLPALVCDILDQADSVPAWTWQVLSGGGWNVDRGNWCIIDSVMAGVSYGKYNIPALIESFELTEDGQLTLRENRLDSMMHFAVSRHAMYRQVYQHRVLLSADTLNRGIAQRARDLGDKLEFADDIMCDVLKADSPASLSLATLYEMKESWWRYHLGQWAHSADPILSDLASRLLHRRLFKTLRVRANDDQNDLLQECRKAVEASGFDPRYYLYEISTLYMHKGDLQQSVLVKFDDGSTNSLTAAEPLIDALLSESKDSVRTWFALPLEAKQMLGRER